MGWMTRRVVLLVAGIAAAVAAAVVWRGMGPGVSAARSEGGPVRAVVSIAPLRGLIEPLLPAGATVRVLIPPGASEHGYEPTATDLAEAARADLVVLVGMGLDDRFAAYLGERPRAGRRVVVFAEAAATDIAAATHDHDHHDHEGHGHEGHGHEGHGHDEHGHACGDRAAGDPHLWLDPLLAAKLVAAAAGEVRAAQLGDARVTADAEQKMLRRLTDLDREYRERLGGSAGKTLIVAHAAYGWLARRYGLEEVALTGLAAGEPTPATIAAGAAALRERRAGAVFIEPQLSPQAGRRLAEAAGVRVLMLDPLGDGDYFGMMRRNLEALAEGLGATGTGGAATEKTAGSGAP